MRALQLLGEQEVALREIPCPEAPKGRRALVKMHSFALNHLDLYSYRGMAFARRNLPITLGAEGVGTVEDAPPGFGFKSGDRVAIFPAEVCGACRYCKAQMENVCLEAGGIMGFHLPGVAAEWINVSIDQLVRIPDAVDWTSAACAALTCATVQHMLFDNAELSEGETILVHGGGSGIGSTAISMAKAAGATVITTVGSEAKAERAREIGADYAINYRRGSFLSKVRRITEKRGVDVVFEHVGTDTWERSLLSLRKGGRLVTCGSTTGVSAQTNLLHLFNQQLKVYASFGGSPRNIRESLRKMELRKIRVTIDSEIGLEDVKQAMTRMSNREVFGKIVVQT